MAESERIKLEVVESPTFSLSAPVHIVAGVVGDNITFTVAMTAVGAYTSDVVLALTGHPTGAVITYDPVDATIKPGETLTVTVDTDACAAGTSDMTVAEAA